MKKYDFDKVIDRKNTNSLKFDFAVERNKPADILPLWVADMDFAAPDEVLSALQQKAAHGIFGYSEPKQDYFDAIHNWFLTRHGWDMNTKNLVLSCGVVAAICTLIRVLTQKGESVIICQPVYYPFEASIVQNGRKLVVSELINRDGEYSIDFDDFERKIIENDVKLFILCNPHNPVGRVWKRSELERLGDICLKHNVFVVSDEIHCDFTYQGFTHTVFASIKPAFEKHCAVCTAPSKTFNLAGLHNANIYIADERVRKAYLDELESQGYSQSNIMGIVGAQAAYTYGADWVDQLKEYLSKNLDFVREFLKANLPQLKLIEPQGTYLIWIDCRALGLSERELKNLIVNKAGLWLDDGYIFGKGGSGFERINIACPRVTLERALKQLQSAIESL
jgi:cystathionine beta-lyase